MQSNLIYLLYMTLVNFYRTYLRNSIYVRCAEQYNIAPPVKRRMVMVRTGSIRMSVCQIHTVSGGRIYQHYTIFSVIVKVGAYALHVARHTRMQYAPSIIVIYLIKMPSVLVAKDYRMRYLHKQHMAAIRGPGFMVIHSFGCST